MWRGCGRDAAGWGVGERVSADVERWVAVERSGEGVIVLSVLVVGARTGEVLVMLGVCGWELGSASLRDWMYASMWKMLLGIEERVIIVVTPAEVARRAAVSLVAMPPVPSAEPVLDTVCCQHWSSRHACSLGQRNAYILYHQLQEWKYPPQSQLAAHPDEFLDCSCTNNAHPS